ncbi:MAG: tetratricopeptide repeat protein [Candidatus Lariskella arthropodorum]
MIYYFCGSPDLEDIVRKLNKFLPNSYTALCEMYDKYPTLINTLEVLVKEIESVEIPGIEVMNLKNRLLMLYYYVLDYEKAKQIIDLLDIESKKIDFKTPEEKSIYATYLLYRCGDIQYDLIYAKDNIAIGSVKNAIDSVKKALEIMKGCESQYPNLLYAANQELADIYVYNGLVEAAEECVLAAEGIAKDYQEISEGERSLLFFVKTKIALYNGCYEQALAFVNQDIEASKNFKSALFKAISISMKGYILLKLGKVEEAMQLSSNFLNDLQSEVGDKHLMNSMILSVMSEAALMKEDIENAEKYVDQSIEILMNILSERSQDINDSDFIGFGRAYGLKGDIEYSKGHYKKALDYYFKALKVYEKRYGKNMKLDHISELYYHIVKAAKQLKQSQFVQKYVHAHDNIFGLKHHRTQELYDLLVHSQLDGNV